MPAVQARVASTEWQLHGPADLRNIHGLAISFVALNSKPVACPTTYRFNALTHYASQTRSAREQEGISSRRVRDAPQWFRRATTSSLGKILV